MTKQNPLNNDISGHLMESIPPESGFDLWKRCIEETSYDKGREDQMEECLRWLDKQDEGGMGGFRDLMWKGMRGPKEPIPLFLQLSDAVYFEEWEKVAQLAKKLKKKQQKENL